MKNKKIACGLAILISILFFISKDAKAASLGNCDYTTMSSKEYDQCLQEQTCPDGHLNSQLNCIPNAPAPSSSLGAPSDYSVPPPSYNPGTSLRVPAIQPSPTNPNLDCSSGVCFPISTNLPNPSGGIATIITNILYWILGIFGVLAIIAFVISGIQYILSTGSEKMIDKAKSSMKWSIVGVAIALSGLIIIYAIDRMLRGSSNF